MTYTDTVRLAKRIAAMLTSIAAHGRATTSLAGTGEITLRDGLVVAAAAAGAKKKQPWVIRREVKPRNWHEAAVDLMISRRTNTGRTKRLGGVEVKWWRKTDASNAANRRSDLLRDFIRAAALYPTVEDFSLVALLTTAEAWEVTTHTAGNDKKPMAFLSKKGVQRWNMSKLTTSKGLTRALRSLNGKVPICNIFHSVLLCDFRLFDDDEMLASAKVWMVRKPQNTKLLDPQAVAALLDR